MLISDKKKFIFIHIYKTAGTSVSRLFVPYSRFIDRVAYDFKLTSSLLGRISTFMKWQDDGFKQFTGFRKHSKASDIKNKLGSEKYHEYFKFIFVRNPFDLLVSLFHYIKQSPSHIDYNKVKSLNFKQFIKFHISNKPNLQIDFMTDTDSSEFIVNYVGRFETLNKDIIELKNKLSINDGKQLQHKNSSKERKNINYKSFYDTESIELVNEYFKKDLEQLGYNFSGICKENIQKIYS